MGNRRRRERAARKQRAGRRKMLVTGGVIALFVAILAYVTWQQINGTGALPATEVSDPMLGADNAVVENELN